jgi:hypothetical protein
MEAPHVQEALVTLMQRWGNDPWLLTARQVNDDAGARLEVVVVNGLYKEDVLPRRLATYSGGEWSVCYLIVRRVDDPLLTPGQARRVLAALA